MKEERHGLRDLMTAKEISSGEAFSFEERTYIKVSSASRIVDIPVNHVAAVNMDGVVVAIDREATVTRLNMILVER